MLEVQVTRTTTHKTRKTTNTRIAVKDLHFIIIEAGIIDLPRKSYEITKLPPLNYFDRMPRLKADAKQRRN